MQFDVNVEVIQMGDYHITWRADDRFQTRDIRLTVEADGDGSRITQETRAAFKRKPGMRKWLYPVLARRIFGKQFRDLAAYLQSAQSR